MSLICSIGFVYFAHEVCASLIPSLKDSYVKPIRIVILLMTVISTLSIALRIYARRISLIQFGVDDYLSMLNLLTVYGLNANFWVASVYGWGRHQVLLPLKGLERFLQNELTVQIVFAIAITTAKISLLFFYDRVFPFRRFRVLSINLGCLSIAVAVAFIMAMLLGCRPLRAAWDLSLFGHCVDYDTIRLSLTIIECVTNFMVVALPVPWLWSLQMRKRKRLALMGIFILGGL